MSDWIDQLRSAEEKRKEEIQQNDELRLHKARIIKGKGPVFWDHLKTQLRADCAKLKALFPNDTQKNCEVVNIGNQFSLSPVLSVRALVMTLNLDGQSIDVEDRSKAAADSPISKRSLIPITFSVDNGDELLATWKGQAYNRVEALSEALIRAVCEIQ